MVKLDITEIAKARMSLQQAARVEFGATHKVKEKQ